MPKAVLILANPIAGGGRARALAPLLVDGLRQHGIDAELHFTTCAGDAGVQAAGAAARGFSAIAVIGGDGTVNDTVNGMAAAPLPLAVLPLGTGNVLATELRLPRRPAATAALIAAGHRRRLAVGRAGERRFLLFCGAGIDGAAVHRLCSTRKGRLGKHGWLRPILHTAWHWPRFSLRVELADGTAVDDCASVLVTRVRNYGGVFQLPAGIDAFDGQLHVLCFLRRRRLAYVWAGLSALLRRLSPTRHLLLFQTTAVRIGGSAPCQIDGDPAGHAPVAIGLDGSELELFAP